jgi:hypothetical protein
MPTKGLLLRRQPQSRDTAPRGVPSAVVSVDPRRSPNAVSACTQCGEAERSVPLGVEAQKVKSTPAIALPPISAL